MLAAVTTAVSLLSQLFGALSENQKKQQAGAAAALKAAQESSPLLQAPNIGTSNVKPPMIMQDNMAMPAGDQQNTAGTMANALNTGAGAISTVDQYLKFIGGAT